LLDNVPVACDCRNWVRPWADGADFLWLTEAQAVLEVARIVYDDKGLAVEAVINVFPSQQWRLWYEWNASDRTEREIWATCPGTQ
jgi:hypothetical protein